MTIAAYTAPEGAFPPYFNARREGDEVVVTVRAPAGKLLCGAACEGVTASMRIPVGKFNEMLTEAGQ